MATRVIDDTKLQNIAVAIQSKDNGGQMTVDEMAGRIENLPSGSDFDMTVTDNQFKMVIEVNDYDLSFWTRFGVKYGRAEISWGDGTSDVLQNDDLYLEDTPTKKHAYQSSGRYLITVSAIDENTSLVTGSINEISVLSEGEMNTNRNTFDVIRILYNYKIKELSFGKKIDVGRGLQHIPCAEKIYGISSSLNDTSSLFMSIRNDITIIDTNWFKDTLAQYIKIPASVQKIENGAFYNCITKIIDFTEAQVKENGELSIVFNSTDIFKYISVNTILLFATQEIAEVAKTTTNLSQLASQIKYVGEV